MDFQLQELSIMYSMRKILLKLALTSEEVTLINKRQKSYIVMETQKS